MRSSPSVPRPKDSVRDRSRADLCTVSGKTDAAIYAIVSAIPRGRVATYGDVAKLAGMPSGHRVVARVMKTCPESLPWYRVIGKKDARRGQINIVAGEHAEFQRARLEAEGVEFDENGFVSFSRFGMLHGAR
jgi:methylated-DNA-protein-cysteine methyltransferase related protein